MIYSGKFKVTSPFGMRMLNGVQNDHKGIDVVGIDDKHVCAVVSGVVAVSAIVTNKSDRTWEWGNYVRVDGDDGMRYYYCHLDKRLVSPGQRIKAGDHIGIEGNTGYSFGQHCHFEVRNPSGESINPTPFLGIPNVVGTYEIYDEPEDNSMDEEKKAQTDSDPSDWAEDAVEWAVDNGIIYGDEHGDLMLRQPCTREQMLVFLHRFAEHIGKV